MEGRERLGRVRERGPVADALRESGDGLLGRLDAVAGGDPAQPGREHLAVGQVRAALGRGLVPRVLLEQLVVPARRPRQRGPERGEETGLPVDQGAVAVEGQRVEAAEVERHRQIMPLARRSDVGNRSPCAKTASSPSQTPT